MTGHEERYFEYLRRVAALLTPAAAQNIRSIIDRTHWDEPESAADLNNVAVLALIEAEIAHEAGARAASVETALVSLEQSVSLDANPVNVAHLALVRALIGDHDAAVLTMIQRLADINSAVPGAGGTGERADDCLVYWPIDTPRVADRAAARDLGRGRELRAALETGDACARARMLLAAIAARLVPILYNEISQRLLHLAAHCHPDSPRINLRLGIACVMSGQWEGLAYLRRALRLDPDSPLALQTLYLAMRTAGEDQRASEWLRVARAARAKAADSASWRWTELDGEPFSSVPFDGGMALCVEASLRSLVTGVLLGEGDWFETEMELWRTQIQEGMTVIDVGANVGVYTFSAAQRVGRAGRVYAVEPFSGCVRALEETCRVNRLSQVRVRAGAASDANRTARLALRSASEMNTLEFGDAASGNFEDVRCFTLDSLIEEEGLQRVDWLKIDAEGHEMSVLHGAERLIRAFKPGILYENIASGNWSNSSVAAHLRSLGYRLFRYRGYVRELAPVSLPEEVDANLNVVALHEDRT